jgi:hypothetical protein
MHLKQYKRNMPVLLGLLCCTLFLSGCGSDQADSKEETVRPVKAMGRGQATA